MKTKLIIFFVIVVIIFILGGIILNYQSGVERHPNEDISTKNIKIVSKFVENLTPNAYPNFYIGKKWDYKYMGADLEDVNTKSLMKCYVEDIKRLNNTDCFLLICNITGYLDDMPLDSRKSEACVSKYGNILFSSLVLFPDLLYSPHTNASIFQESKNASTMINTMSLVGRFSYGEWMLALTEDLKWKQNLSFQEKRIGRTRSDDSHESTFFERIGVENHVFEGEVIGEEKINNKECFKVKIREKRTDINNKVSINDYVLWVDKKERALVKGIAYFEGVYLWEVIEK